MSGNYPPGVTGNEYQISGPLSEREIDCPAFLNIELGETTQEGVRCGAPAMESYHPQTGVWSICSLGHEVELTHHPEYWCCDAGPIGHGGRHWREE